ncbi:type II CAAX endopeptidase family protein [Streptomyces sp. NPDC005732]|uniref:CPBP family intramembrane glutamic endopeptidase n=1 Tax=Streptomyces sp. NPDC005732 TaxID=3157057 RepID=UPI0033F22388
MTQSPLRSRTSFRNMRPPRSTGGRLAVMVVLFLMVTALAAGVRAVAGPNPFLSLIAGAVVAVGALKVYAVAVRVVEGRGLPELDPTTTVSGLRNGTLAGLLLFSTTIALIALSGGYGTKGGVSVGGAVAVLGTMAGVAVVEELLFRAIVFRLVEQLVGTRGVLALTALLFGGLHLVNSGATVWGALAIAVEAGLMLGAAYAATRTLWLPIGLHFGWNFAESGLFGTTVSGNDGAPAGLVHGVLSGPTAVTGGTFGPEASVFAIIVCAVPTLVFLRTAKRRGHLHTRAELKVATGTATGAATGTDTEATTGP